MGKNLASAYLQEQQYRRQALRTLSDLVGVDIDICECVFDHSHIADSDLLEWVEQEEEKNRLKLLKRRKCLEAQLRDYIRLGAIMRHEDCFLIW